MKDYSNEVCCICGEPATWVRSTQFAGDHPYCTIHAKKEDDFGEEDDSTFWIDVESLKVSS